MNCLICDRIAQIQSNANPYFVKELETGYVVLGDFQFYLGYTLFLSKEHVPELHLMRQEFKLRFLNEMSRVAEAVYKAFTPDKLNYEMLGNSDAHAHWHIFPRYVREEGYGKPVWALDKSVRQKEDVRPQPHKREELKAALLKHL